MKTIVMMMASMLIVSCANAQKIKEAEVPTAVKEGFKKHFASVKAEGWEKEGANFEAEFDLNKVETSALFDPNGNLLETESEIAVAALPNTVTEYLVKNYKGEKVKEAAKITEANGKVKYEAEIKGKDILFDESGNLLK